MFENIKKFFEMKKKNAILFIKQMKYVFVNKKNIFDFKKKYENAIITVFILNITKKTQK